jgi:hypothetical protein
MYNNAGTIGGAAAGAGVASAQVLPDTGGLALMPLTGTFLDWVLLPVGDAGVRTSDLCRVKAVR